jgi:hypothetical protein
MGIRNDRRWEAITVYSIYLCNITELVLLVLFARGVKARACSEELVEMPFPLSSWRMPGF